MTDLSVAGTRPRFDFDNDQKAHLFTLVKLLMVQIDQPKGALSDYEYYKKNLQALLEGRAHSAPPAPPQAVPYVQDDWSDTTSIPIDALNLSRRLTNVLRRFGIETVWQLQTTPEPEIYGNFRPNDIGVKSVESIKQALAKQGLALITDPRLILFEVASRASTNTYEVPSLGSGLQRLGVFNIKRDEIANLSRKLGIVTLNDLCCLKASISDIGTELLYGDYDYSCMSSSTEGDGSWHSPYIDNQGVPPLEERIAKSVMVVYNDILTRYGLTTLPM